MRRPPPGRLGRLRTAAVVAVLLGAACLMAWSRGLWRSSPPAASARPRANIVVVLIDTLRADHTSVYGYERDTTPQLRRIATEGLVLRHHFANAPWTKPSVASIFTGVPPSAHGSRLGRFEEIGRGGTVEVLSSKWITLAEALKAAGYHTAAYLSNYHLTPKWGYDQGFDEYRLVTNLPRPMADRKAIEAAVEALVRHDEPVFFWAHLMAVHQFDAPPRWQRFEPDGSTPIDRSQPTSYKLTRFASLEEAVAAYDNAILFDDALVGRLFDALREHEPHTLLLVTSDHGEELADHGGFDHGWTLYPEILRVPAVFWGPGVPVGEITDLTDSLDLLPTILTAAGIEPPAPRGSARALFDDGRIRPGKEESFAEQHNLGPWRRFSLTRRGGEIILSRDKSTGERSVELLPKAWGRRLGETGRRELLARLASHLDAARKLHREVVGETEERLLDAADEEPLRALGYVH